MHDSLLRPLLAAALHLVSAIGPHVPGLIREVAEADRRWSSTTPGLSHAGRVPEKEFSALLDDYERNGRALPLLPAHHLRDRLESGWHPDDPLAPVALSLLARQAGFTQFPLRWIPALRDRIEAALSTVGADKPFARGAAPVTRADADAAIPWTLPLDRLEATGLAGIVRTAAIITLAAVSGMRSSELMELRVGCCRPPESHGPGLVRYRLAGTIIKGQPLGGLADEWVVIEPAYQAARLLEQLHGNPETASRCWDGSPSTSGTHGSGTGSTALPGNVTGSPRYPMARSPSDPCAARYRWSSPTVPADCLPQNCTSSTSPRQLRRGTLPALAAPRPNCSPR